MSRDGLELYPYYMPVDVFSLGASWEKDPICFDYRPYYRPPMLGVDMISNPWGCENFFQGDIVIATRDNVNSPFVEWQPSNLQRSISNEGAPCGVLKDENTFDVFTQNRDDIEHMKIMFMRDVPRNPTSETAVSVTSTAGEEDNPHIERLDDNTLLLFFDRDRHIYHSLSYNNGSTWQEPVLIMHVLNGQAPYDLQPHLWSDGTGWWVYFCAENEQGKRCIYKSKQQIANGWDSWSEKQLVIEPDEITGGYGIILGGR